VVGHRADVRAVLVVRATLVVVRRIRRPLRRFAAVGRATPATAAAAAAAAVVVTVVRAAAAAAADRVVRAVVAVAVVVGVVDDAEIEVVVRAPVRAPAVAAVQQQKPMRPTAFPVQHVGQQSAARRATVGSRPELTAQPLRARRPVMRRGRRFQQQFTCGDERLFDLMISGIGSRIFNTRHFS